MTSATPCYSVLFSFYVILCFLTIWRLITLFQRTKELYHQKIFFSLVIIGTLGRSSVNFIAAVFTNYFLNHADKTNIAGAVFAEFFLSAFLLLIFTLAQIYSRTKNFSPVALKKNYRKIIIIFITANVLLYGIHISLIATKKDPHNFFLASMYAVVALSLFIYSIRLQKSFKRQISSQNHQAIQKIFRVLLICTICYFLRIIALVLINTSNTKMSTFQLSILLMFYYILFEIFPFSVILLVLFVPPPKTQNFNQLTLTSINLAVPLAQAYEEIPDANNQV
ncbi:tobamovirus multiplication protein 1-like isoform x1 [Anaeramoeba ignava]|uniref:Tobamovirus multiplication protein 1-like isoform x1 n=1 Tax=Anaeramoeba ignava TaxID=1746090 RepID=A0A9Q0LUK2_ANAIG|nr:tobamovirus multiplication protein 1-like isoform x1 [Anaeramoeba ignava]